MTRVKVKRIVKNRVIIVVFQYEPAHHKTYDKTCMTSLDSARPVHPPSMPRVLVYLSLDSPDAKDGTCDQGRLIRLCGCPGWSESLLVAQVLLWIFSCIGSYFKSFSTL